jgi:hypothetical protein
VTASLHRNRPAHEGLARLDADAGRFRLGGKKEGAGVAVAVMLIGIMDIEYDFVFG